MSTSFIVFIIIYIVIGITLDLLTSQVDGEISLPERILLGLIVIVFWPALVIGALLQRDGID